jgi:hypothetical protein
MVSKQLQSLEPLATGVFQEFLQLSDFSEAKALIAE